MKGRTVTSSEKKLWSKLISIVGCIACRIDDRFNDYATIHHIDGRTKLDAHKNVLPLCEHHHQGAGVKSIPAVHVNKTEFERRYGKQADLLKTCHEIIKQENAE